MASRARAIASESARGGVTTGVCVAAGFDSAMVAAFCGFIFSTWAFSVLGCSALAFSTLGFSAFGFLPSGLVTGAVENEFKLCAGGIGRAEGGGVTEFRVEAEGATAWLL